MEAPTMLENKAPLILPSFAFFGSSISSLLRLLSLADLHHVFAITAKRWATTPPLPALPPAGILTALSSCWRYERSLIPTENVLAPFTLPAIPPGTLRNSPQHGAKR